VNVVFGLCYTMLYIVAAVIRMATYWWANVNALHLKDKCNLIYVTW